MVPGGVGRDVGVCIAKFRFGRGLVIQPDNACGVLPARSKHYSRDWDAIYGVFEVIFEPWFVHGMSLGRDVTRSRGLPTLTRTPAYCPRLSPTCSRTRTSPPHSPHPGLQHQPPSH